MMHIRWQVETRPPKASASPVLTPSSLPNEKWFGLHKSPKKLQQEPRKLSIWAVFFPALNQITQLQIRPCLMWISVPAWPSVPRLQGIWALLGHWRYGYWNYHVIERKQTLAITRSPLKSGSHEFTVCTKCLRLRFSPFIFVAFDLVRNCLESDGIGYRFIKSLSVTNFPRAKSYWTLWAVRDYHYIMYWTSLIQLGAKFSTSNLFIRFGYATDIWGART